ncbi:autotransporter domain-containing protein [Polaromonas sp. SM01]|uniref:autotransporter domain-containing protein n=1 Tax=Polaromonas sp. SM01 TaxID=3085630 RepID=UPI002981694B|nr:autotransporter domain-containing protein [Polaromonas sp. SM01]MDW5444985.1 autotransporter domain-containing protein [Polaromonas sp. SM01]
MNKVHRITWSKARSAFIVTHENASSGGKPATTCSAVGAALLMLLLNATPALAANVCGAGPNVINTAHASGDNCTLSNNGGSVTVGSTGSLATAGSAAITASGAVGGITINQGGSVNATSTNVGIHVNGATLSGDITIKGNLTSVADGGQLFNGALYASNSTINGSLVNDGGQVGNVLYLIGSKVNSIQNINGGVISVSGNQVRGIAIGDSTVANGILNGAGSSITTSGYDAIYFGGGTISAGGIVNRGMLTNGGVFVGGNAVVNGDILNAGTIKDLVSGPGLYMSQGTLNGNLRNEGSISNSPTGMVVAQGTLTGDIINKGTIQANNTGIGVNTNAKVNGKIVNSGSINGTSLGISLSVGQVAGGIHNTGTISGKDRGVVLFGAGTSLTAGGDGRAIYNSSSGSITAGNNGNTNETAIHAASDTVITGDIVNEGTIGGSKIGIRVDGGGQVNGDINNSGNINGTKYAVQIADNSSLSGIVARGSAARFIGDVYARKTDFTVATGASFANDNAFNVQGFVVSTGAVFTMKAGTSTSGMANGITVGSSGFSNAGTVIVDTGTLNAVHGDYTQASTGSLSIGTIAGSHTKLTIDGTATNAGRIELARSGDLHAGSLNNNGTLALAGGNTISTTSGFSNAGTLTLDATVRAAVTGNYAQTSGGLFNAGNNSRLDVSGAVTNAGKVALGAGATFGAASMGNSGTMTLADGASITTTTGFSNSGTLSLGSSVSAAISGNYTQTSTGVFRIGVNDDTTYAKLAVNGTVNLASNARIEVDVTRKDQVFNTKRLQNVLTATTLNSDGTFAVTDNSLLFDFGAVKDGHAVHLTLAAAAAKGGPSVLGSVTDTGNKPGVGAAGVLDQIIGANPSGAIGNLFVGLTSKEAVSQAVTQTLPLLTGGSMAAASDSLSGINRVVQARIEANRGLSSGDLALSDRHLWFKPFGSWARQNDRDGISGFKANTSGFVAGADAAVSERSRLGLGFAYANARVNGNSSIAPQQVDVDVYQLLGYGSYSLNDRTELNFQADIGQNSNQGSRSLAFTSSTARASYKSLTTHVGVGIGHILPLGTTTAFTPSLRLDYSRIKDKAYAESGAGALNLNVAGRSAEQMLLAVDGKLTHNLDSQTSVTANLGAAYDMLSKKASIVAAFAGAPNAAFTTYGMDATPWSVRAGLGLVKKLAGGMEIAARYDVEGRKAFINQTASVKLRWAF